MAGSLPQYTGRTYVNSDGGGVVVNPGVAGASGIYLSNISFLVD